MADQHVKLLHPRADPLQQGSGAGGGRRIPRKDVRDWRPFAAVAIEVAVGMVLVLMLVLAGEALGRVLVVAMTLESVASARL